ncbi:GNAT family N-acetyltransferase [Parablautia muri]|uniref:GNAT family N-acetyltransferase n=1 Tax=Parablautia muri TaxID=2320879 RepID=A0A9X5BEK5_9FIRM|nr:GNAT family N-acetyltransferase [Parablautia muri]NBJ92460.1 GNAT family N-acetyltransferase [Parablautia muri]
MEFQEKAFQSKNGNQYLLRSPREEDAGIMLAYLKKTAQETERGLSYPEEMDMSIEEEADFIKHFLEDERSMMISVYDDDKLVGGASLSSVGEKQKIRHRASIGIALLKDVWGQGIGRSLMTELLSFAKEAGYVQIELEVVADNVSAIGLYESLGFVTYGRRPNFFRLKDGNYVEGILMVLACNKLP